ncbi:hypothetical protein HHK36_000398 [Tetracentron sinense]|uniref:Uncharacterized protein n=1 Tax=Tetracentron sinense TaxID=13715 RepID=A0A834ZRI1_TETSI|nr:hypothetical protein HHK36_000398 [Tetracentron sinense]
MEETRITETQPPTFSHSSTSSSSSSSTTTTSSSSSSSSSGPDALPDFDENKKTRAKKCSKKVLEGKTSNETNKRHKTTTSPKDIQAAAAKAAASNFRELRSRKVVEAELPISDSPTTVSPSTDDDDTLFDLPDLFLDFTDRIDGFCYSLSQQPAVEEPVEIGIWLEEPLLYEYVQLESP